MILADESPENLLPADPVVGEVDQIRGLAASLSWRELAEGTVRPSGVVVPQVLGQHPVQVVLIDDQQPVEEFPAQGTDNPFADRVRPGRLRRAGQDPDTFPGEHGIEGAGELARAVPDQELDRGRPVAQVHQEVAGCLRCPRAVRAGGDAGQAGAAGAVLDDDQGINTAEQHGVHVDEVDGEDAAGLRGKELLPGRAGAAGRGIDPGVVQDLPHRGGGDRVAEPDQLALHPPVPPRGILRRHADHELADRGRRGRPPGTPPARIVPLARDKPAVPGEQSRGCHREDLAPPAARNQPRQCRQPQPVARLVTDPADLAAQHGVLVPKHQKLRILGHLPPGQHRQATSRQRTSR